MAQERQACRYHRFRSQRTDLRLLSALTGYEVDVFESESTAGGVLLFGIPEYRLPKEVLARDIKAIEEAGVKIHLNTEGWRGCQV